VPFWRLYTCGPMCLGTEAKVQLTIVGIADVAAVLMRQSADVAAVLTWSSVDVAAVQMEHLGTRKECQELHMALCV
jgi:hypothetical protein